MLGCFGYYGVFWLSMVFSGGLMHGKGGQRVQVYGRMKKRTKKNVKVVILIKISVSPSLGCCNYELFTLRLLYRL